MLILTSGAGETVKIGDGIEVTIRSVKGDQVRIGISAPKDIPIHRNEVWERLRSEEANLRGQHAGRATSSIFRGGTRGFSALRQSILSWYRAIWAR